MIFSRRTFLQLSSATAAWVAYSCGRGKSPTGAMTTGRERLVIVDIDGGNDWLQALVPTTGANAAVYAAKRPVLGISADKTTDIGGVGLNNDFIGMADLHARGQVAWIVGVGMPNPSLSHFSSIDLWGQGAAAPGGTGWLGRYADTAFDASGDVLRGLTVTADLPVMLKGATRTFASVTSATGFGYPATLRGGLVASPFDTAIMEQGFAAACAAAAAPGPGSDGELAAAAAGRQLLSAAAAFPGGSLPARTPSVPYPGDTAYTGTRVDGRPLAGTLSTQLKLVAQMIAAGLPTQVFFTRLSGWDTHANEATDHPNLLRTLGGSLAAFWQDLASIPAGSGTAQDDLLIVGYSEFGRRVHENNGGTDHGTAGLALAVGNHITGGLVGDYPDLGNLDANGNMKFTVDFRSLYATVLERWLGVAATTTDALIGDHYPRLAFL